MHSLFFSPGRWVTHGWFVAGDGVRVEGSGVASVMHRDGLWVLEEQLTLAGDPPRVLENRCTIEPFAADADNTTWRAENSVLGAVEGWFVLAGDTILSGYRSLDGRYSGAESLRQDGPGEYDVGGALFDGGRKVSVWALRMVREA